ncbi:MAG: transketolase [Chloroflexi bacterium]|nr:transketolase [Chloroflexota bacterium]
MRNAFIETLCELAQKDERIWLLAGDIGYSVLERFSQLFPARYVNMGVAEQNMTSVAAGLALEGNIVFTYSIANFPVMRCLEQIRNDVCYHNLNVKVVAVGGGLAYGAAGYTHHAVEDLAVMRSMPNMTVLAPGDPMEVRQATRAIVNWQGPCYLRLGKGGEPIVHRAEPAFTIGKSIVIREGNDVTLISTGGILSEVISAAEQLAPQIQARVLSVPTVKPLDEVELLKAAKETRLLATVEEHSAVGGLGSAVSQVLCATSRVRDFDFLMLSLNDAPQQTAGSQFYFRELSGLDSAQIAQTVRKHLDEMLGSSSQAPSFIV